MNLIARTESEKKVLEMLKEGKPIHGVAREILIDMMLDAKAEEEE